MKKRISIILALVLALSIFSVIGTACDPVQVTKDTGKYILTGDPIADATAYVQGQTGGVLPGWAVQFLSDGTAMTALSKAVAGGITYEACKIVTDWLYKNYGIEINPANAAILVKLICLAGGIPLP